MNRKNCIYMAPDFGGGVALDFLNENGIVPDAFIVTDGHREQSEQSGVKIYELSEVEAVKHKAKCGVLICMDVQNSGEAFEILEAHGHNWCKVYRWISSRNTAVGGRNYCKLNSRNDFKNDCKELDEIGKKYGTDKASGYHNYLNKYEIFLTPFKEKNVHLLELGIFKGSSLKMWGEYFKNGQVTGVDILDSCRNYSGKNIDVIITDLSRKDNLIKLGQLKPDVILDDASHMWTQQIMAFFTLFEYLPHGGIYILEDLGTSFEQSEFYDDAKYSTFEVLSKIMECVNSRCTLTDYNFSLKKEIEDISVNIELICFIEESCIIIKK